MIANTKRLTPTQVRLLTEASKHPTGHVFEGSLALRMRLADRGLIAQLGRVVINGLTFSDGYTITEAGREALAAELRRARVSAIWPRLGG